MATAKYTIHLPTADNLGNPLSRRLGEAAHRFLFDGPANVQAAYVEHGKTGLWRNDPAEVFDHLVSFADDHPKNDSAFKDLAHHVGDLANQWGVFVSKESKDGPQTWIINNKHYRHGEPADPIVLEGADHGTY